ncbi:MAG TPA: hypothetical protein VFS52_08780 [Steroidobacteraceae bacterium]|jgi:3-hydroxyacyl-[acyl-carrier-protein] dehydratase|nr:hypothetical protein [Steroidobacteraceae bacterium]
MTERHLAAFTVPASHPSLPGHFPGSPVVPGVVVLDLVLRAAAEWRGHEARVSGLKQVKFLAPLLPEERAEVALEASDAALGFRVSRGEQVIAQGTFVVASDSAARGASDAAGAAAVPPSADASTGAAAPASAPATTRAPDSPHRS